VSPGSRSGHRDGLASSSAAGSASICGRSRRCRDRCGGVLRPSPCKTTSNCGVLDLKAPQGAPYLHHLLLPANQPETKSPVCGAFAEPSDGLEPSTPSLPWNVLGNRWQLVARIWLVLTVLRFARSAADCCRLQPPGSIEAPSRHRGPKLRLEPERELRGGRQWTFTRVSLHHLVRHGHAGARERSCGTR
jgi:hypothetical protein